jgi:D-alanyl-D-alanine carboxypeptidase
VFRALAVPLALLAFHSTARPLNAPERAQIVARGEWHQGCPVPLSGLRLLTLRYWGFDDRAHTGQLVVNASAVAPLSTVFGKLYDMHFPIHHMAFAYIYDKNARIPADGDLSGSFECRQAVPSPCTGGTGTGHWSMHAYGLAVDINARENPYVGCGMTRDKTALSFMNRSRVRKGMVTPAVVAAFRSVGWGWGGSWTGSTHDYMHFSATGH